MKKLLTSLLLAAVVCTLMGSLGLQTVNSASGSCGTALTWSLDQSGTLTVQGSGEMTSAPWSSYNSDIRNIIIRNGVTGICDNAFLYCTNLQTVSIPDGLTYIGKSAFDSCTSLVRAVLPDSVRYIGERAFYDCSSLKEIVLPSYSEYIGDDAFTYCAELESVTLPNGLTSVSSRTFYSCEKLTEVVLPASLQHIGERAFGYCENLTDISLPVGLLSIGTSAFTSCASLSDICVPPTVSSVETKAFERCSSLKDIELPPTLENIGEKVFEKCSLVTVHSYGGSYPELYAQAYGIPFAADIAAFGKCGDALYWTLYTGGKLTVCGSGMMWEWNGSDLPAPWDTYRQHITSVEMLSGNSISDYAFAGCLNLTDAVISAGVTRIGCNAFDSCIALQNVLLPGDLDTVGHSAFSGCQALQELILPEGTSVLAFGAFAGCTQLSRIVLPKSLHTIGEGILDNCPRAEIHGYANSTAARYAAEKGIPFFPLSSAGKYTITGTIRTDTDMSAPTVVELYLGGSVVQKKELYTADYSLSDLAPGTYTLRVSKDKHVTREYEVVVGNP